MKIAVLAFGSCIKNPQSRDYSGKLDVQLPEGMQSAFKLEQSPFAKTNLTLPIALGRISSINNPRERLTNVIDLKGCLTHAYCAESNKIKLDDAIKNLREREGISAQGKDLIGYVNLKNGTQKIRPQMQQVASKIQKWAKKNRFDAVIWTDLPSNFKRITQKELSDNSICEFLNKRSVVLQNTVKYINDLPEQNPLHKKIIELARKEESASKKNVLKRIYEISKGILKSLFSPFFIVTEKIIKFFYPKCRNKVVVS